MPLLAMVHLYMEMPRSLEMLRLEVMQSYLVMLKYMKMR